MRNKTEVNPINNATVVNSEIGQATVINKNIVIEASEIAAGSVIAKKYTVIEPLSVSTGEANLYLCTYMDTEYVVKIYRRQRAIKSEVIEVLKSINSPFVASLFDTGIYKNLST